ncbi:MAG: M949_RS01915 family surface polysaccharide biosynthesis protein [Flavobacterium sp.]
MNKTLTLFLLLISFMSNAQNNDVYREYYSLQPDKRINILNTKLSNSKFNVVSINYEAIPSYLDYRGTVIEAVKWKDDLGDNLLILTSGIYYTDIESQLNKTEIYAYLFTKDNNASQYSRLWRLYDFIDCGPVDTGIFYIRNALTVTDLNNNGIAEISFPYFLQCRGDISDDILKYMLYENNIKYALRGTTKLCKGPKEYQSGGVYTPSDNLKNNDVFSSFLQQQWNKYMCWETIRYPND